MFSSYNSLKSFASMQVIFLFLIEWCGKVVFAFLDRVWCKHEWVKILLCTVFVEVLYVYSYFGGIDSSRLFKIKEKKLQYLNRKKNTHFWFTTKDQ